jgi:hypothetical protein
MIGCFDQGILATVCYAGMTARLQQDDIGQKKRRWPVLARHGLHGWQVAWHESPSCNEM